ncbi:uncharacterized protein LOC117338928 [Pecten maximus]|uniref:uncharacterized protein LOC117338928 n=1 Tax=Pecten maximus TaxID=6579 RepID=UPI001458E139|nr:uncharacterized protein LOC117338928 [Pecten maximus]
MTAVKVVMEIGTELGYKGTDLQKFVKDEQDRERDERQSEREQKQKEWDEQQKVEQIKLSILKEQRALEMDKEERAARDHARKMELLEKEERKPQMDQGKSPSVSARGPKLPAFEEGKDNIDSYLQRFERYATTQGWNKTTQWASNLSVLLKGRALDVFSRLPVDQSLDYDVLKGALLKRFEMTEDSFRKRFRSGRPETGETFSQFAVRLESDLVRWMEMASVDKTYDGLRDLMVRDQFLQACGNELKLFLKERIPKSIVEMSTLADQFAEARGNASNFVRPARKFDKTSSSMKNQQSSNSHSDAKEFKKGQTGGKHCFICKKPDHMSYNCPKKSSSGKVGVTTGRRSEHFGVNISCYVKIPKSDEMPVVDGRVDESPVSVLRDTGCSGVVIKRSLVGEEQMTGETQTCKLADGSKLEVPIATVFINTPYYVGSVVAWCMDNPLYDVIIGNIEGARQPRDPDTDWKVEAVAAVQTRAQRQKENRPYRALNVPTADNFATPDEIKAEQEADDSLVKLWQLARNDDKKIRSDGGKSHFYVKRGLLYREFQSPSSAQGRLFKQLVVPTKLRPAVMKLAHDSVMSGHLAAKRTTERILSEFYWPGLTSDVTRFCRSCDVCQRTFPKGRVTKVPLGVIPLIGTPFQRVAIDLVGPLQPATDRGNRYILTLVDYATRYPEAIPLKGIETERVAEALVDIYSRVGVPSEVLTDQGAQFTSELMREVSRLLSIRQLTTTPYHPMCNGLVERFNGTFKQMLRRMCAERPRDWDKYINALLFAYREVPQESLGFSPFEMLYDRTVRGPMMILKELWTKQVPDPETKTTYQYVIDLKAKLEDTCEMAQKQLRTSKIRQASYYNRKTKERQLNVGQKVLILLPTKRNKLEMQWRGPYRITEKMGSMDYKVDIDGKVKTVHANLLRRYVERGENSACQQSGIMSVVCVSIVDEEEEETVDYEDGLLEDITMPQLGRKESAEDVLVSELLTKPQRKDLTELMEEFVDVLTDMPGNTSLVEHDIKTTTSEPVRLKPHNIPFNMKETIRDEVDKMLKMGVIHPSKSPYSAGVVIVRKKDGTNRFCVDYRHLNRITVFDAEPMPDAEDIFSRLAGHQCFPS